MTQAVWRLPLSVWNSAGSRGRSRRRHSEFGSHSITADCARLLNPTWTNSERRSQRELLILVFVSRLPEGGWNARQAIRARQRIVLQGEIISGNGLRMSCAIRDISDRGARVSVVTPFHKAEK